MFFVKTNRIDFNLVMEAYTSFEVLRTVTEKQNDVRMTSQIADFRLFPVW